MLRKNRLQKNELRPNIALMMLFREKKPLKWLKQKNEKGSPMP